MGRVRPSQEAKDKLSEEVREAGQRGSQASRSQTNLAQFFLESPLRDSNLDLKRDRPPSGREIAL